MNTFAPLRMKLAAAAGLALLVAAVALAQRFGFAVAARATLVPLALGAIAWWLKRSREGAVRPPARLSIVSRASLSSRAQLALVSVDGREFVIVYGDSFAQLTPIAAMSSTSRRTVVASAPQHSAPSASFRQFFNAP